MNEHFPLITNLFNPKRFQQTKSNSTYTQLIY